MTYSASKEEPNNKVSEPLHVYPIMCKYFNTTRGCKNGEQCRFAHTLTPCKFFNTPGGCLNGSQCAYPHIKFNKCKYRHCVTLAPQRYCSVHNNNINDSQNT